MKTFLLVIILNGFLSLCSAQTQIVNTTSCMIVNTNGICTETLNSQIKIFDTTVEIAQGDITNIFVASKVRKVNDILIFTCIDSEITINETFIEIVWRNGNRNIYFE